MNSANRSGSFRLLCLSLLFVWATLAAGACNFGSSTAPGIDSGTLPSIDSGIGSVNLPDSTAPTGPMDATTGDGDGPAPTFTIGGTVTGLVGAGLVLRDNGGDDLAITASGPFTFKTHVASGGAYSVTAYAQPSKPAQVCTVSGGSATVTGNVTSVQVTCVTDSYPVGGTLVGLATTSTGGVVLADAIGGGVTDTVAVNQNGSFTFPTKVPSGATFAVTVKTNPTSPVQTCNVSGGTGTIVNGPVTSVVVNCATNAYVLGGTVSGLTGQGLVLSDGNTTVAVSSNGSFAFSDVIPNGTAYAVAVQTQPTAPSQTCSVTGGTGTMGTANVTSVSVACVTAAFPVGGTVSGLTGSGLVLQDNGGDTLAVTASGTFVFPTAIASGSPYAVTVQTQPTTPWETCTVTGGAGNVGSGAVTSIQVACVPNQYTVSVASTGVVGKGLTLTLNSAETLAITTNGTFTFTTTVASGTTSTVAIGAEPTGPTQTCTVGNGSAVVAGGTVDVTVSCSTQAYAVGGTISGLTGTGLVLTNNGGDKLTILPNATTFTMPALVASGAAYDIEVATSPTGPSQTCTVTGNKGTIVSSAVNSVVVNCGTNSFTVGGNVTGLAGKGLVLLNGTDKVDVTAQGSFAFPTPVVSGGSYDVTVGTQPTTPTQICTVTGGGPATVTNANVTTVAVACVTQSYSVGGTVANLAGSGLVLEDNGADDLAVTSTGASTPFTFKTAVASNATYAVTVKTQPTSPWQTCTPASTTGTVGGANVSVPLSCTTNTYQVSASVTGLSGSGLILTLNGGSPTSAPTNGTTYSLGAPLASGASYTVGIQTQPSSPSQTCTVSPPGTVIAGAAVTVAVSCTTSSFSVGGTVSGLTGSGLVLTNSDNGNTLSIPAGATSFKFSTLVPSGQAFNVGQPTVQPSNPTQSCTVAAGAGTVGNGNVTGISVNCQTNSYTIGGTITLANDKTLGNLALTLNNAETIHPTSTSFVFATHVPSGGTYNVTVTQPTVPTQSCVITNNSGSGTVVNGNINSVTLTCTTTAFPVDVTLSGLIAGNSSVVLQDNGGNNLTMNANTTAAFTTSILSGQAYSVTVATQPISPAQTCVVQSPAAGTIGAGPASVKIVCTPNPVTVSVTVYNGASCTNCAQPCPGSILLVDLQGTKNASTSVSATGATVVSFSVPYGDSEQVYYPGDPNPANGQIYCECSLTGSPTSGPTNWCPNGFNVGDFSCEVPIISTETMTSNVSTALYCYYYAS